MLFNNELRSFIYLKQREIYKKLENIRDFNHRDEFFKIKKYVDSYINGNLENRFLVMPGLRGVGKTTIIFQIYDYLLNTKKIPYENMLYLSMDQLTSYFQTDLLNVIDIFLKEAHNTDQVNLNKKIFIFVDESHFDKKWATSGKIIYDNTQNIFLIFTGSSAIDLEINADIARRISKEIIFPNNFKDHLSLKHNISINSKFSDNLKKMIYFGEEKYIDESIKEEIKVHEKLIPLNNNPNIEFESFLKTYGFPFTLNLKAEDSYNRIFSIVGNIIEKDVPSIKSFNSSTTDVIRRIILYIALSPPGGISNQKIASYLSISPTQVREILDVLEKTQLLFNVKPYGGNQKIIRKPWEYYFLSPSIKSAINFEINRYNLDNRKCLGALAENFVASTLYKLIKTDFKSMGLFYPPEKGSCDFIIRTKLDEIVPIEVGIGKKTKSQLRKTMGKYNSKYGILVSNRYERIKHENNIIYIPLMSFGFI